MNFKTLEILEEELVLTKATAHRQGNEIFIDKNGNFVDVGGNVIKNYCSGNFLGFDKSKLIENESFACEITNPFSCGNFDSLKQLEHLAASFMKYDGVGVFSSYDALCADVLSALVNNSDAVIYDENINPALMRGIQLCNAQQVCRCKHNNISDYENALKITQINRLRFIVVDGIYARFGHFAMLKKICFLAEKYDAFVVLDDSLGFLSSGKNGFGSDEYCGVRGFADVKIVNMQNSLCAASGAFLAANKTVVELVKRRVKAYQYAVTISPADICVAKKILSSDDLPLRLEKLNINALNLYEQLKKLNLNPQKPCGPVVVCSVDDKYVAFQETIKSQHFLCQFVKYQGIMTAIFYVNAI